MPTWNGDARSMGKSVVLAETVVAGELGSVNADGLGVLACAGSGVEELPCYGVYELGGEAGDVVELKSQGFVTDCTGLTPGDLVYVSDTPGAISASAGNTSCVVGKAWSATVFELCLANVAGDHQVES